MAASMVPGVWIKLFDLGDGNGMEMRRFCDKVPVFSLKPGGRVSFFPGENRNRFPHGKVLICVVYGAAAIPVVFKIRMPSSPKQVPIA